MSTFTYQFDDSLSPAEQARIQEHIEQAFLAGEIMACHCPAIDVWVYPTIPPDFQASLSCSCDAMRPIYSSTPDNE
jgi:hypothetical protein